MNAMTSGGQELGGAHSDVFCATPESLTPRHGFGNGALCRAAKDMTSGPSVSPSELCDLGKARVLSGLRLFVCEMRGQVLTACEIPCKANTLSQAFQTVLQGSTVALWGTHLQAWHLVQSSFLCCNQPMF